MSQATHRSRRDAGQALVEFALVLPVLLLILLFALDFGRVFLGWISLNNIAKIGANYATQNPQAWGTPGDASRRAEYATLIGNDIAVTNCSPVAIPDPAFTSGTTPGNPVTVSLTCNFTLITPFIGAFIGNPIPVSASATYAIRAGVLPGGITVEPPTAPPTCALTPTPDPGATPSPAPTATPLMSGQGKNSSQAQSPWSGAGFTTIVIFNPIPPPNYTVVRQEPAAGTSAPCGTTIGRVFAQ